MLKQCFLFVTLLIGLSFPIVVRSTEGASRTIQAESLSFFQKAKQTTKKYGLCAAGAVAGSITAVFAYLKQKKYGLDAQSAQQWLDDFRAANDREFGAIRRLIHDELEGDNDIIGCKLNTVIDDVFGRNNPEKLQEIFKSKGIAISLDDAKAFVTRHTETVTQYWAARRDRSQLTRGGHTVEAQTGIYNSMHFLQKRWKVVLAASVIVVAGSVAWAVYKARSKKEEAQPTH